MQATLSFSRRRENMIFQTSATDRPGLTEGAGTGRVATFRQDDRPTTQTAAGHEPEVTSSTLAMIVLRFPFGSAVGQSSNDLVTALATTEKPGINESRSTNYDSSPPSSPSLAGVRRGWRGGSGVGYSCRDALRPMVLDQPEPTKRV
jgi:hypothetical protein